MNTYTNKQPNNKMTVLILYIAVISLLQTYSFNANAKIHYETPIEARTMQGAANSGCNYDDIFTNHKIKITEDGLDTTPSISCTIVSLTNNRINDNLATLFAKKMRYINGIEAIYLHFNSIGEALLLQLVMIWNIKY